MFKLVDVTDDYGPIWDTKGHVVPLQYHESLENGQKAHTGLHAWLDYPGHWGNKGVNNCWWHRALGYCQVSLVDHVWVPGLRISSSTLRLVLIGSYLSRLR